LTSAEEVSGKIKLYYEESQDSKIQIKDGLLLIIKFINDGDIPIKSEDFDEPISISFRPDADILSAEIIRIKPESLKPELDISKHKIILKPLLLNQKDTITVKMVLMKFRKSSSININGRIVDIPEIKAVEQKKKYRGLFNIKRFVNFDIAFKAFMVVTLLSMAIVFGIVSTGVDVVPNFVAAEIGENIEATILVPDDNLLSKYINSNGVINASSFPYNSDSLEQPNITLTIKPNSFQSAPATAKMHIHIGQNVKAGVYRIALNVNQRFDKRTTSVVVAVKDSKIALA
jgi:hypothetical protein